MKYGRVVSIHGTPRSGTSWLGKIFDSHSDVAYRFQPLFSYRFKNRITLDASADDINRFLQELYEVRDDDFILGKWRKDIEPDDVAEIKKCPSPSHLVIKEVRYHHLIKKFLATIDNLKVVGIVRNPCAVINSWLQAPKEFDKKWDPMSEWRFAPSKNLGKIEEYNGYEKWKELTTLFLEFQQTYPDCFYLVEYEQLVANPIQTIKSVFSFVNLEMEQQVMGFIHASQSQHVEDAYAVYKSPAVKDRWRGELDTRIVDEITKDLSGTPLERFLK
jgi:hypothetical protein